MCKGKTHKIKLPQNQAAQQTVDQELLAVAGGGNRRFAEAFENARQLLGPQWPMVALAMLAPSGQQA